MSAMHNTNMGSIGSLVMAVIINVNEDEEGGSRQNFFPNFLGSMAMVRNVECIMSLLYDNGKWQMSSLQDT